MSERLKRLDAMVRDQEGCVFEYDAKAWACLREIVELHESVIGTDETLEIVDKYFGPEPENPDKRTCQHRCDTALMRGCPECAIEHKRRLGEPEAQQPDLERDHPFAIAWHEAEKAEEPTQTPQPLPLGHEFRPHDPREGERCLISDTEGFGQGCHERIPYQAAYTCKKPESAHRPAPTAGERP